MMRIFILDGSKMLDIEKTHKYLAKVLMFPGYYGHNLDALYDCLTEFDNNTTIIILNIEDIYHNLGEYGGRLLSVFDEAAYEELAFHLVKE